MAAECVFQFKQNGPAAGLCPTQKYAGLYSYIGYLSHTDDLFNIDTDGVLLFPLQPQP